MREKRTGEKRIFSEVAENFMKGKPLLPTLRTKKRYVVFEIVSGRDTPIEGIFQKIFASFKECFGLFSLGKAGLMDTRIVNKNRGIIKVNHTYVDHLKTAMAMIDSDFIVHSIGVSGILKKAKSRYMEG